MSYIFNRMFFDKDNIDLNTNIPEILPLEQAQKELYQVGGKVKDNKMEYFQRWNIYFFIFFLSVFFAIMTVKDKQIVKGVFKQKTVPNMADVGKDDNERWVKIVRFTCVFIALIIAYHIGFFILAYFYIGFGNIFLDRKGTASSYWKEIFWKYKNPFKKEIFIGKTYMVMLIMVLLVVFVCYIGFSKWFPDWFDSLYFQTTIKKKDDTQTTKYAYYYGLFLITMMLFFIMILNLNVLEDNQLYMYYNIIFAVAYLILIFYIIRQYKNGDKKKLAFITLLVFIMFFLYPILLSLIKMEKGGKDIFSGNFLKNLIFNFGLN